MLKLKLWQRLLLYTCMVVFAALALINVAFDSFSFVAGITCYVLAAGIQGIYISGKRNEAWKQEERV